MRSASSAAAWSPSMTEMAILPPSSRAVRSSSVVLPAPGELIRLIARMPRCRSQSRFCLGQPVVLGQHLLLQLDGPLVAGVRFRQAEVDVVAVVVVRVLRAVLVPVVMSAGPS